MNKLLLPLLLFVFLTIGITKNTYSGEVRYYDEAFFKKELSLKSENIHKDTTTLHSTDEHVDELEAGEHAEDLHAEDQHAEDQHAEGGQAEGEHAEDEHGEGDHGADLSPLFFIIIALLIGAATRHFLRKSPIPFTVMLILLGLLFGVLTRLDLFEWSIGSTKLSLAFLADSIKWAGTIDSHLILYIFLPILIFEAAFAMDVHTFRKTSTNAIIMAVPGIVVALVLSGAMAMGLKAAGLGFNQWGWPVAFMFGAVISATDPVAVVSLLKELGASKKLGTLIEGESLLNDGTAIVIFMVFLLGITGDALQGSPIVEFARVSLGGILVGIIIGVVCIAWVRRVFNDALVEISVIIAAAYLTFYVAEHFMHVSGVLGLVAFGLAMASVGRTRISPEVEHFLHEFWELAAFIANTLIFFIVGVVIAQRTQFTATDFIILGIVYIGIHVIRAIVIFMFFPFMRKTGYGLSRKDSYVLWYGALRGAIGLALALIVAGESKINSEIRDQFLFLTAGIVTLTLLINATTIKYLLNKLGLTKIAPAKALMILNANKYLRQSSENALNKIKEDRFMNRANWNAVKEYMPDDSDIKEDELEEIETIAETRRRILEKEKSSYWHQFKDGLLGPTAVRRLSDGINEILDEGGLVSLSERKDLEELWNTPKLLNKLQSIPIMGRTARRFFFEKLTVSYDCARGFVEAQEEALKLIESMNRSLDETIKSDQEEAKNLVTIESEINENRIHGLTFLRNLRKNYPEIYNAISTRQASRSLLNYEKRTVERLLKNGRIENDEAHKMIVHIEERMKKLMDTPPTIKHLDTVDFIKELPLFKDLDDKTFEMVEGHFQNKTYAVGDKLIKEHGKGEGMFLITRGSVKVSISDQVVDILGNGSIFGELAGLTGLPRTASVEAETPTSVLWMSSANMTKLMHKSEELEKRLWQIGSERFTENLLSKLKPYNQWRQSQLRSMLAKGSVNTYQKHTTFEIKDKIGVLLSGKIEEKAHKKSVSSPAVLEPGEYNTKILTFVFIF